MYSFKDIQKVSDEVITNLGLTKPWVDVELVARSLNLELHPSMMAEDTDGMLVIKNGKAAIGFNHNHSENRKRFTIAHEIGHYQLHHGNDASEENLFIDKAIKVYRRSLNPSREDDNLKREREANVFAANLLMPKFMVQKETEHMQYLNDVDIKDLAEKFKVSEIAMTYRLQNLGILF